MIKQLHSDAEIYLKACPLLVSLVEENWIECGETKRILKKYLKPFKSYNIDTLILGCTHYPLLSDMISNIMGRYVTLVDPAHEVVKEVKNILESNGDLRKKLKKSKNHKFYFSDITPHLEKIAQKFLGRKMENIEKVDLEQEIDLKS
jgi:glutamate racemase